MELVYLWVEKYKNIENEGFNFSPRFECEFFPEYDIYQENGEERKKLKDNCKLEIKPKEYTSIFPDKINVTAIVGENGSGKSSIIKFLNNIFNLIPFLMHGTNRNFKLDLSNFVLVINIDMQIYYISTVPVKSEKIIKLDKLGLFYYYLYLADEQIPIEHEFRSNPINNQISLDEALIGDMITSSFISDLEFKLTTFMYLPSKIEIKNINLHEIYTDLISDDSFSYPDINLDKDLTDRQEDKIYKDIRNQKFAREDNFEALFEKINDEYHLFLIIWFIRENGYDDNDYLLEDKAFLISEYDVNSSNEKITEEEYNLYFKQSTKLTREFTTRQKDIYFKYCKEFFNFDFIDSLNRRFNDLSHGEKTIYGQFINIYYYSIQSEGGELCYLLDEPDLSLHPQWQKGYFFELHNILKNINCKFNIILTTHSPFILSDLPKENVIFLKDGKQDKTVDIETFGANIHTLLSHGFFMRDGLMGEFAKGKINEAIRLLNQKTLTKEEIDYCENIISIIGEPILQKTLRHQLNEKLNSNETELQRLERQQKEIQDKIDKLKGR